MIPRLENYQQGFGAELLCSSCGSNNLHHDKVEVFERGEDALQGLHVVIQDGKTVVDNELKNNPSSRRHGLKITFWCEGCKETSVLSVSQHKGVSLVDFQTLLED